VQKPVEHSLASAHGVPSIPEAPPLPLLAPLLLDVLPELLDELAITLELLDEETSIPPVPPMEPDADWDPT
jgi:hypothetical protein